MKIIEGISSESIEDSKHMAELLTGLIAVPCKNGVEMDMFFFYSLISKPKEQMTRRSKIAQRKAKINLAKIIPLSS